MFSFSSSFLNDVTTVFVSVSDWLLCDQSPISSINIHRDFAMRNTAPVHTTWLSQLTAAWGCKNKVQAITGARGPWPADSGACSAWCTNVSDDARVGNPDSCWNERSMGTGLKSNSIHVSSCRLFICKTWPSGRSRRRSILTLGGRATFPLQPPF